MRRRLFLFILLLLTCRLLPAQGLIRTPDGHYVTSSGGLVILTPPSCGTLTVQDADGNSYHTVLIGTQCWMKENLATTKYNDGTEIPNVSDPGEWTTLTTAGYCWYTNDAASNKSTFGALYNWYAADNNPATKMASNGGKNICPNGWHIPSQAEWMTLFSSVGSVGTAGGKLKQAGVANWSPPNTGADNSFGFTALPGGYRTTTNGAFYQITTNGFWYSSTAIDANTVFYYGMVYNLNSINTFQNYNKFGLSLRCLKN